jgi:bla regulator protein blaR1
MIPIINEGVLAVSSSLAASILVKLTVAITLGLAGAWLARGTRAAVRHALLVATFGVILLLPMAALVMPPHRVGVPIGVEMRTVLPPLVIGGESTHSATTAKVGTRVPPAKPPAPALSQSSLLLAAWAIGTALFLLPVIVGLWQIRLLRRSGMPWQHGQSIVEALALDAGIHRQVDVRLHEALPGPMTCGVLHPAIVLPRDAENWDGQDLNRAIIHELEHVRRGDWVTCSLARAISAAYWFHPFVWIAWRKLVLEAERSCDDAVLERSEATDYANQLVGLAKQQLTKQRSPLLAMVNRADLAKRVGALLDTRQRRGRVGILSAVLACAAAAALVIAMAPLKLVAAPQAASQPLQPAFDVASIRLSKSDTPGPRFAPGPQSFAAESATLRDLVLEAYGLKDFQVSGGPRWTNADRFDVQAKGGDAAGAGPGRLFTEIPKLQTLLQERFKLVIHRETRELPIYELTVAKDGFKLQPLKDGACVPRDPQVRGAGRNPLGTCGYLGFGRGTLEAASMRMSELADAFSMLTGRTVVDKTGIAGTFRVQLTYIPDESLTRLAGPPPNPATRASDGPDLFTAMQEQLGLKLESAKGPVPVIVIDSVERPSEN